MKKHLLFIYLIIIFIVNQSCNFQKRSKSCKLIDSSIICTKIIDNRLVKIETFKKANPDILNGISFELSINGDTIKKSYYTEGRLIGGLYEYYQNGQPKRYICFDSFNQDTMFHREYGINNEITKEEGEMLYGKGYTSYDKSKLITKGFVDIYSVLVSPPKSSNIVKIYAIKDGFEKDTLRPISTYFEAGQNNMILVNKIALKKHGRFQIYTTTEVYDSLKKYVLRKSEVYQIKY